MVCAVLGPQSGRLGGFEGREGSSSSGGSSRVVLLSSSGSSSRVVLLSSRSSSSGSSSSRVVLLRAARGVQPGVPAGHHPPALTAPPSSDAKFHLVFSPNTAQGKLGAINCLPDL